MPAAGRLTDLWREFWQQSGTEDDDEKRAPIRLRFNRDDKPIDDEKRKVETKLERLLNFWNIFFENSREFFSGDEKCLFNLNTLNTV